MKRFTCFETMAVLVLVAEIAHAQTTTRVSVDSSGVQSNHTSQMSVSSNDGRYVALTSLADNLVQGDTNNAADVFAHDRQTGQTTLVSVDSNGLQGNSGSGELGIAMSSDARFIAFASYASSLVPNDTNGDWDVFVRDRLLGITEQVSVASNGAGGNNESELGSVSADGRYVTFYSTSTNLVSGDTNGAYDVFVRDRRAGQTTRISVDSNGVQGNAGSLVPSMSEDARIVAFASSSTNLVPGDLNGLQDVFVHDRQTGQTMLVSVDSNGAQANGGESTYPSISADGRYVAFESSAHNLVSGDTNGYLDVFVHDRQSGVTERVSVATGGAQGNNGSVRPWISADGRLVAFQSASSNLGLGADVNPDWDVFVHDRQNGTTELASISSAGVQGNGQSAWASISGDGQFVMFQSRATNLVPGDTNGQDDVFVHDRNPMHSTTPFCFGDGTGAPCPCDNSGQSGHGCDNSISTGGAMLAGTGDALLSADTLLLTSSYERPTAFSLFWQAGSEIAPRVFGDGLGCMGPPLKRMYRHHAVGGSVTAPQGTDQSVSARSATLGDPISAGSTRGYYVFYRDPTPTFCPPPFGSTFNTTNGLRVLWGG